MRKTIADPVLVLPPSVREIGFGVAAFTAVPGAPAGGKKPGFPGIFPSKTLPGGKKS